MYKICWLLHSEFKDNVCGSGGILGVAYFPISLSGNISFINSAGPALRVSGVKIIVLLLS